MTGVRVTAAQARAMGVDSSPATSPRARTTRTVARGPYRTRCHVCGDEFTTMASEDRHVTLTHSRFELVL